VAIVCTLRDGIEVMVRVLGEEMVWLCCVGRGTAGPVAIVCTLRDEKESMVFWAKRWSTLEGEQLDEWQLYVEGRDRSYGTCAGRSDGLAMLR
jgi:hypothetical protein